MAAFKNVTENYKTSDKAPESYYYVGECYNALGKPKEAQAAYNDTIKLFPDSNAASLAKTRIK
jgi:TolA-binding protein